MNDALEIRHDVTRNGRDVFDAWLTGLADPRAQAKISVRRVCVLLLCGGDKRKQSADIEKAAAYLED